MHHLPRPGQRVAVFLEDEASGATLGYYGQFVAARLTKQNTYDTYLVFVPFLRQTIEVDRLQVFVCPLEKPLKEELLHTPLATVRFTDTLESDNKEIKGFYRFGDRGWEHFLFVKTAIRHVRYEYTAPVNGATMDDGLLYYEVPSETTLNRQFVVRSLADFLGRGIDWQ